MTRAVDHASDCLAQLLKRHDRRRDGHAVSLGFSAGKHAWYYQLDNEQREQFHAVLQLAASAGAVQLDWNRNFQNHELRRLLLIDAERLAACLGRPMQLDRADVVVDVARKASDGHPQLLEQLDAARNAWCRHEPFVGLNIEAPERVRTVFRTVAALLRGQHAGHDMRSFSAQLLGDSKAIERNGAAIEKLWACCLDLPGVSLAEDLGFAKYPQPFLWGGGAICPDLRAGVAAYCGLPPDSVRARAADPAYVLSIENYTSFVRYVSTIRDDGLVLYCAGFPGPAWRAAYARITEPLSAVPLWHWGDLDLGGFRIAECLAQTTRQTLSPYRMVPDAYRVAPSGDRTRAMTATEHRVLSDMKMRWPKATAAIDSCLGTPEVFGLEQELLAPQSPTSARQD